MAIIKNLDYLVNNDIEIIFDDFTVNGLPYPNGSTPQLVVNWTSGQIIYPGTFTSPDEVKFDIPLADNNSEGNFSYQVDVTEPGPKVTTHIGGFLQITSILSSASYDDPLLDCLKYSVGLSQSECECLDQGKPIDYNRSDSGYYLDDMELAPSLQFPKAATDCESFWTMMDRARKDGIRDFMTDFIIKSKDLTNIKVSPYDGGFADTDKINTVLTGINKQFLVARYKPLKYVRGAVMEVREIGLIMNMAQTYTVHIYKSSDLTTPLHSLDINVTTANQMAFATVPDGPWRLPMWEEERKLTYYFVYDRLGASPLNMRFNCGCRNGSRPWEKHLHGKGIQTDDVSRLEIDNQSFSDYSYGILVKGSLTCDGFDWMCRNWNYTSDSFGRVMARLIQLYSVRKLHALILNSSRVNAYTLLKKETLQARMVAISKMIEDPVQGNIGYLFRNIPRGVTGCWECEWKIQKRNLLV